MKYLFVYFPVPINIVYDEINPQTVSYIDFAAKHLKYIFYNISYRVEHFSIYSIKDTGITNTIIPSLSWHFRYSFNTRTDMYKYINPSSYELYWYTGQCNINAIKAKVLHQHITYINIWTKTDKHYKYIVILPPKRRRMLVFSENAIYKKEINSHSSRRIHFLCDVFRQLA